MSPFVRLSVAALLTFSLVNCQCGTPAATTCDPAFCAGCCIDGMCRACPSGNTDGGQLPGDGGNPQDSGTVTPDSGTPDAGQPGGVDGGTPDAGAPDAGNPGGWIDAGTGAVTFDGGWVLPTLPPHPALVGDGGTTQVFQSGSDPSAPGKFSGNVNPADVISVVYPPDGVLLPPNTNALEFHFIPTAGETLFRFTFHAPTTTLVVYTGCNHVGAGCVFTPDATFWLDLVAYARGTAPVKWTVEGVNGSSPASVGSSSQQSLSFSEQDITGGIYYWNSAGSVVRYDFGYPNAPSQVFADRNTVGAMTCVGCHVISRQGNLIALGKDIPAPAAYSVLNVVSRTVAASSAGALTGSSNFFSFSPDEKHMLQSDGNKIEWRDLVYGTVKPVSNQGTMPDWSPDGSSMVYVKGPAPVLPPIPIPGFSLATPGVQSGALQVMPFNGTGFGSPQTLVPSNGQNNYYPAYSPDGEWVLFNRSPSNRDSMSNASPGDAGTPDGELWAVDATGGTPVKLAQASNPGNCAWPKWAPVRHDYASGQVLWLTFSSARSYGLRLAEWERTQLWMVAFDPDKMRAGQDPSFPAFWLPFQDMGSGNHIGQWSTTVPRASCTSTNQCGQGEVCYNGKCRPG